MKITYEFDDYNHVSRMPVDLGLKAGTPVDSTGAEANDGNAIGILLFDSVTPLTDVLVAGYVDADAAQASYGDDYESTCVAALENIVLVSGGKIPAASIPAPPEDDGSYVLSATVADGVVAYSWEAAE